jgi:hypothetical protein
MESTMGHKRTLALALGITAATMVAEIAVEAAEKSGCETGTCEEPPAKVR